MAQRVRRPARRPGQPEVGRSTTDRTSVVTLQLDQFTRPSEVALRRASRVFRPLSVPVARFDDHAAPVARIDSSTPRLGRVVTSVAVARSGAVLRRSLGIGTGQASPVARFGPTAGTPRDPAPPGRAGGRCPMGRAAPVVLGSPRSLPIPPTPSPARPGCPVRPTAGAVWVTRLAGRPVRHRTPSAPDGTPCRSMVSHRSGRWPRGSTPDTCGGGTTGTRPTSLLGQAQQLRGDGSSPPSSRFAVAGPGLARGGGPLLPPVSRPRRAVRCEDTLANAFGQVKRYFRTHRVIHRDSPYSPESRALSTVRTQLHPQPRRLGRVDAGRTRRLNAPVTRTPVPSTCHPSSIVIP